MNKASGNYAMLDCCPMETHSPLCDSVRQHYLFAGLDEARFEDLAAHMSARKLDKNDVLFHRGDKAENVVG